MTQLYKINVNLTPNQKKNLANAFQKRETIILRLGYSQLTGSDTVHVPANAVKKLEKSKRMNKGMDIKLSKSNIRKQVGDSLLSTALSLGMRALPTNSKTIGLAGLSATAETGVKKLFGKRTNRRVFDPNGNLNKLAPYTKLLTSSQMKDFLNALQSGKGVHIRQTKQQEGAFLGALLSFIALPLALKGAPRIGAPKPKGGNGHQLIQMPDPFIGTRDQMQRGMGKKKRERFPIRKKQSIQQDSNFRNNSVKPKFHKK